jgi:hypothetical protein
VRRQHAFVHRAAGAATLIALLGIAPVAAAQASPTPDEGGVRIESSTCPHGLVEEVQHLARVELNGVALPQGVDAPRVILTCAGSVTLIRAMLGVESDSRQLDLDQTDDTLRARVIALASAELVRDTASRTLRRPAVALAPPAAPLPEPNVAFVGPLPPAHVAAKSRLVAFGKLGNFGSSFDPLYGGGLGFAHDLGRLSLGLGSELLASERDVALGSVQLLAADLSLRLALRFPSSILPSEVGLGHALGIARIRGKADSPDAEGQTISGTWAGPFLFGGFESQLGEPFFLQFAGQLGIITFPVHGQVARSQDVRVSGMWAGLSLGLGLNL